MAEMKNNSLLEQIIRYAKALGGIEERSVTAERFVVAALDAVGGVRGFQASQGEKQALKDLFASRFEISPKDLHSLRNFFAGYIEEDDGADFYMDVLYMQQRMYEARNAAANRGLQELTAEDVLKKIFEDPTPFLKEAFHTAAVHVRESNGNACLPETEPKLFDDLFRFSTQQEKEEAASAYPREELQKLSREVVRISDLLNERVFGQENAIEVFTSGYFRAELNRRTEKERTRPAATFLFAGPPGVGKTFLVKNIVEILGMQDSFMFFDMSAYADPNAYLELIGHDDNYKNPREGLLTGFVHKHPKCILLFDEIEKTSSVVLNLFLQILEEGFVTDKKTQERVSFKDAMIFFTSNLGRKLYNAPDAFNFSGVSGKVIMKALQREINPNTQRPYLPAAICSRLAMGNVVMFNHLAAGSLCEIVETTMGKKAESLRDAYGIQTEMDRDVYTALLFAEGGAADARTLRGHVERFFDDGVMELSRLLSSDEHGCDLSKLESVRFNVELPENREVAALFRNAENHNVLVFSSPETVRRCADCCPQVNMIGVEGLEEAKHSLRSKSVGFAVIDLLYGDHGEKRFLNIEDMDSTARDIFWYIRETYDELPVYILQRRDRPLSKEERSSYLRVGVQGFLSLDEDGTDFSERVGSICRELYQRANMRSLASSNRLISYESGQWVSEDGKRAEVTLFDFELSTAVDAEDTQNVMSSVSRPDVTFADVIGAENAKEELRFFIEYLRDPKNFVESGLRAPRGALLYGPPGTGKTMLAKAVAAEAGVTFMSAEGNQFLKRYVGQGKDQLHELFSVARKYAPTILFIDEFESIAQERRGGDQPWAKGEEVLTALLTEMDGFNTDIKRPVFVLAATNFDVTPGGDRSLDQALLRRFDSLICVDLPNKEERIRFMKKKCSGNKAFAVSDEEINNLALRSTGMSLSALDSIMERALRIAVRKDDRKVTDQVLDEAFESFTGGEEKSWDASLLESTARHEAGHAFLCWHGGETPSYVTIVARGSHGGYMQHGGEEGKSVYTREEQLARIRTALGGRAAEIVYYGSKDGVTTGASGDLATATSLARRIICSYGMDDDFGLAVIPPQEAERGELAGEVRAAVNKILRTELKNAIAILEENKASVDALVERLLSENHLTGDEIKQIFEQHKQQG